MPNKQGDEPGDNTLPAYWYSRGSTRIGYRSDIKSLKKCDHFRTPWFLFLIGSRYHVILVVFSSGLIPVVDRSSWQKQWSTFTFLHLFSLIFFSYFTIVIKLFRWVDFSFGNSISITVSDNLRYKSQIIICHI